MNDFYQKLTRVLWDAVLGFRENRCSLRASALTLYTLLSIVPVMAMAFGLAKGFGFQQFLEAEVMKLFAGQEEIMTKVLAFSNNLLERTKGSLMAVFGVVLLLYALVKLMSHIESAFNKIWRAGGDRPLIRKITDYLTISLAAGLLIIFSGTANIFVTTRLEQFLLYLGLHAKVENLISFGFTFFPYLSTWILFIFFYMIIPNQRVEIRAAVAGGIIGGTLFQILQMVYLKFQLGVSGYNAIYGSFAALPLFLIWLQSSWHILLYGAQIAFFWENSDRDETRHPAWENASPRLRKTMMLRIVLICVKRFAKGKKPATDIEIARELKLPFRTVQLLIEELVGCRILYEVRSQDASGYSPARDIECLGIMDVLSAIDHQGNPDLLSSTLESDALEESLNRFEEAARTSPGERLLKDI